MAATKSARRIGGGGQGSVYLAHDKQLDIDVAIKILSRTDEVSPEFVERFRTEAQISARLDHPNIVRIYDYNPTFPYIVMEHCEGGDLRRVLKSGRRRPLSTVVGYIRLIAQALQVAHEHDPPILHRDLKPGNVLFKKGVLKVGDFGLAKVLRGPGGLSMTRGSMLGTPSYMSPEQITDRTGKVDARCDIWGLGVMLYELLSWSRPFDRAGDHYAGILLRVTTANPFEPRYDIPSPLMSVVRRALRKEPADRFGSVREVIGALDSALANVPDPDELIPPESALREEDRLVASLADDFEAGEMDRAEQKLRLLSEALGPDHSLVRHWRGLHQGTKKTGSRGATGPHSKWFDQVRELIGNLQLKEARELIGKELVRTPDNPLAGQLLSLLRETEQQVGTGLAEAYSRSEALREAGDLAGVVGVWSQVADRFPKLEEAQVQLAIAQRELKDQEQERARGQALTNAKALADTGDLPGAVEILKDHLASFSGDSIVGRELEALQADLARQRRAARVAELRGEAERRQQQGDLDGELAALEALLTVEPGDAPARQRREAARRELTERARERASRILIDPGQTRGLPSCFK